VKVPGSFRGLWCSPSLITHVSIYNYSSSELHFYMIQMQGSKKR
jgi:hypothetical protein